VKYPYIRGALLDLWRKAKEEFEDPVEAWESIVADDESRARYQRARGKGGFRRGSWEELQEIIAASVIYTIKKHGPIESSVSSDSCNVFSSHSGPRFFNCSGREPELYDWYQTFLPRSEIWASRPTSPKARIGTTRSRP
jgi:nitrate reductase alpha subunit